MWAVVDRDRGQIGDQALGAQPCRCDLEWDDPCRVRKLGSCCAAVFVYESAEPVASLSVVALPIA
jgi:hypothetical protein